MKYKVGDKVFYRSNIYTISKVNETAIYGPYALKNDRGEFRGWFSEKTLKPVNIDPEEATEQFQKDLDNGFYEDKGMTKAKLLSGIGKEPQTYNKHQSKIDLGDTGYDDGYKDGYEEAKTEFFENRYQEGLQDAWELAQEIVAMNNRELADRHFEVNIKNPEPINAINIISVNLVTEVLDRVKAYEQERRKIKVGDIVAVRCKHDSTNTLDLVMDVDSDEGLWVFDNNECASLITPDEYIGDDAYLEVTRTGRTYNIQSILDQLKE